MLKGQHKLIEYREHIRVNGMSNKQASTVFMQISTFCKVVSLISGPHQ